jgi:protein deglycase
MAKVLVFLADGFEEIEAVTIIDVLRRAEVSVTTAGLTHQRVTGAHGIVIEADCLLGEIDGANGDGKSIGAAATFDALVLPGGMPGSRHLRDDARVKRLLIEQSKAKRLVAAICAAPIALEAAGILRGRMATSYPGFPLSSAQNKEERVVVDDNIITSRGPGTALEFALTLVERLVDSERARQLRVAMIVA